MWPHLLGVLLTACSGSGGKDTACSEATLYVDADGDGFGVGEGTAACAGSVGYAAASGDCDDTDPSVHPGAAEACNGHDDDCDGVVDPPDQTWYLDQDGDGYAGEATVTDCAQPENAYAESTDCDDANWTVYPGADDSWYDGVDSDCGGEDDYDADGDGFASEEHSPEGTDCDDGSDQIHPEAEEICEDEVDQDCTGRDAACGPYGDHDATDADMVLVGDYAEMFLGGSLVAGG